MKVLWITNVELPKAASYHSRSTFLGGWLDYSSRLLSKRDVELHVCSKCDEEYDEILIDDIYYSSFKENNCENVIYEIIEKVNPDIINIWGTEYYHSYATCKCAEELGLLDRVVVSIQGLISYIVDYYYADIPEWVINKYTLSGIKNNITIAKDRDDMVDRSLYEKKTLQMVKHCIGRTSWDFDGVKKINENINYHKCNDILRESFYEKEWNYDNCDKHTIFFSQANYPLKGFHFMIEAANIIKEIYPDLKIRVLGNMDYDFNSYIRDNSYRRYLRQLIKKYDLKKHIEWLGSLDEKQMVDEYIKCNVFVCASSIENSSNSVSEAMLLGVPVVASDVGGIRSLMEENKEGFIYCYNDVDRLAEDVIELFEDKSLANNLGHNAYIRANVDHNPRVNIERLLNIYKNIPR